MSPPEPPRRRWWMAKRVLLAALGVVLLSGGATAVLAVNEVNKVVEALGQNKAVKLSSKILAPTSRGGPETLLLVGDDRRPPPKSNPYGVVLPHSNEMLLVRIDPSKPTISMMSIPRELQVTITPPGGQPLVNRINAAYTIGGIQLMTETIKRVIGISVNHVFVITFPKFKRAVNEMGCVYMEVDRRYYHHNEPFGEQYFEINLQPGYQRMCGREALEFVANRHEDTSVTRDARDQRFLLAAKDQYGASLFEEREKFERILGRAVETDLHGSGSVLDLLAVLVQSQGKPVRRVHFQATLLPTFDTATPTQIHESVSSFLNGTAPLPKHRVGQSLRSVHSHVSHSHAPPLPSLAPTEQASVAHARSLAPSLPFSLEYPRFRHPYLAAGPDTLRLYDIRDRRGTLHPSYVIVVQSGPLGEYYDVQGTTWKEPPLLAHPTQAIRAGTRTYELFYDGEQVRTVSWQDGAGTYWIENTLTNGLSPREMIALAEQTAPVVTVAHTRPQGNLSLRDVSLPARPVAKQSTATSIGALVGIAALGVLLLLGLRVLTRARELGALRYQVSQAMRLEASQRALLAAAATPAGYTPAPAPRALAPRRIYRARRRPGARAAALAAVALTATVALVLVLVSALGGSSSEPVAHGPVPVSVYNATANTSAARTVAHSLRANHVHVSRVGTIKSANLGPGAFVLYPPGARRQATTVAHLIPGVTPTVTAIQPQLQSTLGRHGEIVIVLD
jgi:polyisoprenyl-teichoic acid--peptidoglycan teichoic acid transferase